MNSLAFAPNYPVKVNLKRHAMDVALPGDRTVQMAIENRAGIKSAPGSLDN